MNKTRRAAPKHAHVVGRKGFARISAVEGIRMTAAMEADFRGFEKLNLAPSERRRLLTAKYGKAR